MKRWYVLLIVGVAALPSGCLMLPQGTLMPFPTAPSDNQPAATAAPELSAAQRAQACVATAETLEKEGYQREALLEYQLARQYDPRLPGLARGLAVLYAKQGEVEHARTEFQAALQEQPRDADLWNDSGYFHYQQGECLEAEKDLRQALALDSRHQRAWVNLGKVLVERGRYEESCAAFGHAVRPAQAAANVGILLAKEGKVQEARKLLHQALGLEADLKAARLVLLRLEPETLPEVRLLAE